MDLGARRAAERAGWEELEGLLARLEKKGERGLSFAELDRLGGLYRQAAAQLAEARESRRDPSRARYLDALVRRAHFVIYAPPKRGLRPLVALVMGGFGRAFRETSRLQVVAALLFFAGAIAGWLATFDDVEVAYPILGLMFPADLVQGLIESAEVREAYITSGRDTGAGMRSAFAAMLAFNNGRVAVTAFALGIAGAVPTVLIQAINGAVLGSMAALFNRGDSAAALDFWAWVLPHGIPEILAINIAAAAGLSLGLALIDPRGRPRRDALAAAGRRAAVLVGLALLLLLYAAAIEGWFRQMPLGLAPRFALAAFNAIALAAYLGVSGRGAAPGSAPADLPARTPARTT